MSDDIAEFLRRAAQRRSQPPPDIEIIDADVIDAEILEDGVLGADVAHQVTRHLDTSSFDERASHLGENVDRSDDRMETHLQDVFEHQLGQLGTQTSAASDSVLDDDDAETKKKKPAIQAGTIAEMLRDPQSLRNAIVAREILTRPEHRW